MKKEEDTTYKYGCPELASHLSFSPMYTNMKMQGYYACIWCNYSTYHIEGGKARTKYTGKKKKYTCHDVVSLLDKGPGVRK